MIWQATYFCVQQMHRKYTAGAIEKKMTQSAQAVQNRIMGR